MKEAPNFSYEEAFQKLEKILTNLNEGDVSLDRSLELFEEANGLIETCSKQLSAAEKRIEKLVKGRNQEVQVDEKGEPQIESFEPPAQAHLNQTTGELS